MDIIKLENALTSTFLVEIKLTSQLNVIETILVPLKSFTEDFCLSGVYTKNSNVMQNCSIKVRKSQTNIKHKYIIMARLLFNFLKKIIYLLITLWRTRKTTFFDFDSKFLEVTFTHTKQIFDRFFHRFVISKLENILGEIADAIGQKKDVVFFVFSFLSFIFYLSYSY